MAADTFSFFFDLSFSEKIVVTRGVVPGENYEDACLRFRFALFGLSVATLGNHLLRVEEEGGKENFKGYGSNW